MSYFQRICKANFLELKKLLSDIQPKKDLTNDLVILSCSFALVEDKVD